jgi:hypothetical protein
MLNIPITFDELLKVVDQLSDEQKRVLSARLAENPVTAANDKPKKPRVLGLHPGAFGDSDDKKAKPRTPNLGEGTIWISDDFDDPLPDEFWLGEDS